MNLGTPQTFHFLLVLTLIQFWWIAIIPFVVVNITALWLLRIGRANVSALVLLTFWTISITSVIIRFGAQTFFPALLILPISAASLLFQRRSSLVLAVISAVVSVMG